MAPAPDRLLWVKQRWRCWMTPPTLPACVRGWRRVPASRQMRLNSRCGCFRPCLERCCRHRLHEHHCTAKAMLPALLCLWHLLCAGCCAAVFSISKWNCVCLVGAQPTFCTSPPPAPPPATLYHHVLRFPLCRFLPCRAGCAGLSRPARPPHVAAHQSCAGQARSPGGVPGPHGR